MDAMLWQAEPKKTKNSCAVLTRFLVRFLVPLKRRHDLRLRGFAVTIAGSIMAISPLVLASSPWHRRTRPIYLSPSPITSRIAFSCQMLLTPEEDQKR